MDVDRGATLLVSWLATYTVQSSLVFICAELITRTLSRRFDRVSETLWKAALALSVLSPLLQALLQREGVKPTVAFVAGFAEGASGIDAPGAPVSWPALLALLWMAGALCGIAHLQRVHRAFKRLVDNRRTLTETEKRRLFGDWRESSAQISISPNLAVPVALEREVCLPEWALQNLSPTQLRTIVAHESAHLRRGDARWRWASALTSRVFFFQPLNWVASRRLRELAECLCDEDAVVLTGKPVDLASALGAFAAVLALRRNEHHSLAPSLASNESLTLRRVRRMLSEPVRAQRVVTPPPRGFALLAFGATLAALAIFAPKIDAVTPPSGPYTVTAEDPAGPFTLTIHRGRVISATIAGRPLSRDRVRQHGSRLELLDEHSPPFSVTLTPQGGITWHPRTGKLLYF